MLHSKLRMIVNTIKLVSCSHVAYNIQTDFGVLQFSVVRMAERSKAPDSRLDSFLSKRDFWSPHGGVGSNPTPDKMFTCKFHPCSFITQVSL